MTFPPRSANPMVAVLAVGVLGLSGCAGSGSGTARGDRRPVAASRPSPSGAGSLRAAPVRLRTGLAGWHLPRAISRAVAFADGSRIVLAGGLVPGDRSIGDVTSFDPASGAARRLPALRQPCHDAAGLSLAGARYVVGGGDTTGLAGVQQVGATGAAATEGTLPQPRSDLATAVVGTRGYVLGGYTGSALPAQVLVTSDGRHYRYHGALAVPVRYAAVAALGGGIYLFGGLDAGGAAISDVQRYDPATGRTRVVGHLPSPMSGASAVVLGGRLFVAGGRLASGAASRAVYRWRAGHLRRVGRLRRPVANAAAVAVGDTAWLLGGEAASDLATVQTLRLSTTP